jgi:hypothetical protein
MLMAQTMERKTKGTYQRSVRSEAAEPRVEQVAGDVQVDEQIAPETMTSQVSMENGKLNRPRPGIRCQKRSGRPRSTVTKKRQTLMAATASNSPTMTTSCMLSS